MYHLHAGYRCGITTHPTTPHTAYPIAPTHLRHSQPICFMLTDAGAWMVALSIYPKTKCGWAAAWTSWMHSCNGSRRAAGRLQRPRHLEASLTVMYLRALQCYCIRSCH